MNEFLMSVGILAVTLSLCAGFVMLIDGIEKPQHARETACAQAHPRQFETCYLASGDLRACEYRVFRLYCKEPQ